MRYAQNKLKERRYCVIILVDEYDKVEGYRPSLRFEGIEHYFPLNHPDTGSPWFWGHDIEIAERGAYLLNKRRGLSTSDVKEIRISCIHGTDQWIEAEEKYKT